MIRITVLTEDSVRLKGLKAEHGLSMLIETLERTVLFDTGQSSLFLENARTMGIELANVDDVILSHCHYDHSGGVPYFANSRKQVNVYAHPDLFLKRYKIQDSGSYEYAGLPWSEDLIKGNSIRFHLSKEPVKLSGDIILTGEIPTVTDFESVTEGFYIGDSSNLAKDSIFDDQAMIIKTPQGLVIILGCSHRGVINIIKYAIEITGIDSIHTVIGGMHLIDAGKEKLSKVIGALKSYKIKNIIPLHCTGFKACAEIYRQIKPNYVYACAGSVIEI